MDIDLDDLFYKKSHSGKEYNKEIVKLVKNSYFNDYFYIFMDELKKGYTYTASCLLELEPQRILKTPLLKKELNKRLKTFIKDKDLLFDHNLSKLLIEKSGMSFQNFFDEFYLNVYNSSLGKYNVNLFINYLKKMKEFNDDFKLEEDYFIKNILKDKYCFVNKMETHVPEVLNSIFSFCEENYNDAFYKFIKKENIINEIMGISLYFVNNNEETEQSLKFLYKYLDCDSLSKVSERYKRTLKTMMKANINNLDNIQTKIPYDELLINHIRSADFKDFIEMFPVKIEWNDKNIYLLTQRIKSHLREDNKEELEDVIKKLDFIFSDKLNVNTLFEKDNNLCEMIKHQDPLSLYLQEKYAIYEKNQIMKNINRVELKAENKKRI